MAKKIVKKVIIDVDDNGALKRTSKDAQTLNRNMKGLSKQSSNASKNFSKTAQGMQGVLVPAYAEVAARVFALTAVYQALTKASDFRILMQGQAEYAKRTGKNMALIARNVQKASKGMLNFADASSAVALATTSGISSGQIVEMTKRAVDSSTALGRSVQDTMDRLTRGIVKAEPEILDEIGVIIRLDKVYKDYAQSVSKSTAELSEGEKATARYNAIMGQLETKFGGIADKVDPNYIRASAAATLDILAQSGAKFVGLINPIFKFLSETKAAIVVILLVIVKTLAGKIFPVFESFGAKIVSFGEKGAASANKYANRIKVLNDEMLRASLIAKDLNTSIAKNIPTSMQTIGPGQKGRDKWAGASEAQKIKSLKAKTNFALRHIEKGVVTMGSMKGQTLAEVTAIDNAVNKLGLDVGNTHSKMQVFWTKGSIAAMGFRRTLAQVRMGFAETVANAGIYFGITKGLIADNGFLRGTWMGLKQVGAEWLVAARAAGVYGKVVGSAKAITGALGVVAAATAVAVNKIFAIVMIITMVISFGKMILDMFIDFDTPFKRAADAAKTLSNELKEQSTLLSQKDKLINFEGAAASFDEAMANATFLDNFASTLYESTSKAMKALSADMEEQGFFEGIFDWIKSIVHLGSLDYQEKAFRAQAQMMMDVYPEAAKALAAEMGLDGFRIEEGDKDYKEYLRREKKYNKTREEGDKAFIETLLGKTYWEKVAKVPTDLMDFLISDTYKALDKDDRPAAILEAYMSLNDAQKKAADSAKALKIDMTEMVTTMDALSKVQKKFTDSLVKKTAVHDMAVEQRKMRKLFGKDSTASGSTKVMAMLKGGYMPAAFERSTEVQALLKLMEEGDQAGARDKAQEVYEKIESLIPGIVGGLRDWVTIEEELLASTTERLELEMDILLLKKYAPNTSFLTVAEKELEIAEKVLYIEQMKLDTMRKENTEAAIKAGPHAEGFKPPHSAAKVTQAQTNVNFQRMKAILASSGSNLSQLKFDARVAGTKPTIGATYDAMMADVPATLAGRDDIINKMKGERYLAYVEEANKLINKMGVSAKEAEKHLMELYFGFKETHRIDTWLSRLKEKGFGKFMDIKGVSQYKLFEMTMGTDKEARALPAKIKATKLELQKLKIEEDGRHDHKILVELRKKMAEIDMNTQKGWVATEEKRLATLAAFAKMQKEVNKLQREEDLKMLKDTLDAISNSFKTAISDAFKDIVTDVKEGKWDKFRNTMGEGMLNQAASSVGGMAQKAVFGNKGILAGALRMTPFGHLADDLFPQTQLEIAKDSLKELEKQTILLGGSSFLSGLGKDTIKATGGSDWGIEMMKWGLSFFAANGGIASGGFRAFANGGIANRPTLGMIGEGRYNEAVVPLPDGRSIPVKGAGSNSVTVNVAIDSNGQAKATQSDGKGARELGYQISQAVQQELVDQQRPGGLLSSY